MRFLLATAVLLAAAFVVGPSGLAVDSSPHLYLWPSDTSPRASRGYTTMELSLADGAPAPAALTIYVPSGYTLFSKPSGSLGIAYVTGTIPSPSSPSKTADLDFAGQVVADNPAKYANDPEAQACAPGAHAGVWLLVLPEVGYTSTVTVAFFVDPTSGADTALGAYRIEACFPPPGQLQIHSGGSLVPLKLLDVELAIWPTVFYNPPVPGLYQWRAFLTSYVPYTWTVDSASTIELRADVAIPQVITAKGRFDPKTHRAIITGRLLSMGKPRAGIAVHFDANTIYDWRDAKPFGITLTKADGTYTFTKRITTTLWIFPYVQQYDQACENSSTIAPSGCADESISRPPPPLPVKLTFTRPAAPKRTR